MPSKIEFTKDEIKEIVGRRVAKEFNDGDVATLGIGLPTYAADYVDEGKRVVFQSENGLFGSGKIIKEDGDPRIINAGGACVELQEGCCFYDTQLSFMIMRGGHIDVTVLGALQVDEEGSIASWLIPNKFMPGIGGSMDLIIGAKKVIVAMEHTSKGEAKIVKKCQLPLTAYREVDLIITERAVFKVGENGLILCEINPNFTVEDIKECTEANFSVSKDLKPMSLC